MRIAVPLTVWDESEGKGFRKHPVNNPDPVNEKPAINQLAIRGFAIHGVRVEGSW